jgi:hypothetical protein
VLPPSLFDERLKAALVCKTLLGTKITDDSERKEKISNKNQGRPT